MSVLITGMEMPENCIECPLRKGTVCDAFQLIQPYTFKDDERAAFCPMTEVPEPKTGTWIGEGDGYSDDEIVYDTWYCSECDWCIGEDDQDALPNFCPNCGADMRGADDESTI